MGPGIGLPPNGMRALALIGAAEVVARHSTYVGHIEVWDKNAGLLIAMGQAVMEQLDG